MSFDTLVARRLRDGNGLLRHCGHDDLPELEERPEASLQGDAAHKRSATWHLRGAVMDSITPVFAMIRREQSAAKIATGRVGKVFSTENPILISANWRGSRVRTTIKAPEPEGAHSLEHDLNPHKEAQ